MKPSAPLPKPSAMPSKIVPPKVKEPPDCKRCNEVRSVLEELSRHLTEMNKRPDLFKGRDFLRHNRRAVRKIKLIMGDKNE